MYQNSGLLVRGINLEGLLSISGEGTRNGNGNGNRNGGDVRKQNGNSIDSYTKLLSSGKALRLFSYENEKKMIDKDVDDSLPGLCVNFHFSMLLMNVGF